MDILQTIPNMVVPATVVCRNLVEDRYPSAEYIASGQGAYASVAFDALGAYASAASFA